MTNEYYMGNRIAAGTHEYVGAEIGQNDWLVGWPAWGKSKLVGKII